MAKNTILAFLAILLLLAGEWMAPINSAGLEKLRIASPVGRSPATYLPFHAAEEKNFWASNGLDGKWTPFKSGRLMYAAVVSGDLKMGTNVAASVIRAMANGVPVLFVSNFQQADLFVIFATTKSGITKPEGLRGARFGVPRIGGLSSSYAALVVKKLGLEKEVKFVGAGGMSSLLAGLKSGVFDATIQPTHLLIKLKQAGLVREIARFSSYHPKKWPSHHVWAERKFTKEKPQVVRAAVRTMLQATNLIRNDKEWAVRKMMSQSRFSRATAEEIYSEYIFTANGKMEAEAFENVAKFLVERKLASKKKLPPVQEMFTEEFIR